VGVDDARELLSAAIAEFHPRIALSTAFGVEGVVLLDMLMRIEPSARVFTIDTGRLPPRPTRLMDAIRARYDCTIDVYFPSAPAVETMVRAHGVNLFYSSVERRKQCCAVRKVEPLGRALTGLQAWITGLRRDQAVTRRDVAKVDVDRAHGGIVKLNPLADWSTDDVWRYVRAHKVPYNELHDQGYPSIGARRAPGGASRRGSTRRAVVVGGRRGPGVRAPLSQQQREYLLDNLDREWYLTAHD